MLCFKKDHPKTPVVKHLQHPSIFGDSEALKLSPDGWSRDRNVKVKLCPGQMKHVPKKTKSNKKESWYIMIHHDNKNINAMIVKPHTSNFRTGFSYSNPISPGLKRPPPDWSSRDDRYCVTLLSGYRCPPSNGTSGTVGDRYTWRNSHLLQAIFEKKGIGSA